MIMREGKKALGVVVAMVLLLAGCRHRPTEPERETAPAMPPPAEVADSAVSATGQLDIADSERPDNAGQTVSVVSPVRHDRRTRVKAVKVDPQQLVGEWVSGTLHERYMADGTGLAWDTDDDVSQGEARHFAWQLDRGCLVADYALTLGGKVPKVSYVTEADSLHMVRCDDYGNNWYFKKNAER